MASNSKQEKPLPGLTRKVTFLPRQAFITIPAKYSRALGLRENPYVSITCDGESLTMTPLDSDVAKKISELENDLAALKKSVGIGNADEDEEEEE
jgi:bifunctional DNA-binding transcriptional regulator/antitoxin component of YhaV-PrlF toxin-antitoxin module